MWDSCLHLFTGYPEPAILHIDSIPRECRRGSHSKARGDGEAGGERQMLGQLLACLCGALLCPMVPIATGATRQVVENT